MKSYRLTEVKSYNVPFVRLPRPVFWFNDPFEAGTWSDLHRRDTGAGGVHALRIHGHL